MPSSAWTVLTGPNTTPIANERVVSVPVRRNRDMLVSSSICGADGRIIVTIEMPSASPANDLCGAVLFTIDAQPIADDDRGRQVRAPGASA
jgi:hypothetical protein